MIVDDLNIRIGSQIFPQLGNKHIHASSHEIIIVSPNLCQDLLALQNPVAVAVQQLEDLGFLLCEGFLMVIMLQRRDRSVLRSQYVYMPTKSAMVVSIGVFISD